MVQRDEALRHTGGYRVLQVSAGQRRRHPFFVSARGYPFIPWCMLVYSHGLILLALSVLRSLGDALLPFGRGPPCSAALRLHRACASLVSLLRTGMAIAARFARRGPVPVPQREGDQSPSRLPGLVGRGAVWLRVRCRLLIWTTPRILAAPLTSGPI